MLVVVVRRGSTPPFNTLAVVPPDCRLFTIRLLWLVPALYEGYIELFLRAYGAS
jgi:hypothetical protein